MHWPVWRPRSHMPTAPPCCRIRPRPASHKHILTSADSHRGKTAKLVSGCWATGSRPSVIHLYKPLRRPHCPGLSPLLPDIAMATASILSRALSLVSHLSVRVSGALHATLLAALECKVNVSHPFSTRKKARRSRQAWGGEALPPSWRTSGRSGRGARWRVCALPSGPCGRRGRRP